MGRGLVLLAMFCVTASVKTAAQSIRKPATDSTVQPVSLKILPPDFYKQQLGFTCKKELQLQKLVALPVYIRLGSKDYVDYLERKPNAVRNNQ